MALGTWLGGSKTSDDVLTDKLQPTVVHMYKPVTQVVGDSYLHVHVKMYPQVTTYCDTYVQVIVGMSNAWM